MKVFALACLLVMAYAGTFVARAQVPRFISYQGSLTDSAGIPKPDGDYVFTFRFYADSVGGVPLWTDQRTVALKRGLFSTKLGGQPGFVSIFTALRWLSVQVGGEMEIPKRIPLAATTYAFRSIRADTAQVALSAPLQQTVDSARIAGTVPDNSITSTKILNGTIQRADVAPAFKAPFADTADYVRNLPPIDSARIAGTVPNDAITGAKILDGTIQRADVSAQFKAPAADIADTALHVPPIAPGSIDSTMLASNSVSSTKIVNNSITEGKIAPGQVVRSINDVRDQLRVVGRGSATVTTSNDTIYIDAQGGSGSGIQGIQTTNNTLAILNPTGPIATINVRDQGIGPLQLTDSAVTTQKIASGAVTQGKIAAGVSLPPIGPAGGALAGAYPNPTLATGAVSTAMLADGSVSNPKLADASVTQSKIAAGVTLPPGGTAGGDLTGTYPNPMIASNAVTAAKLADGSVGQTKIADAAVTQTKIAAGVTLPPSGSAGGDLSGAYPNPVVAANAITTPKLADSAVGTTKIANAAITQAKIAPGVTLPPSGSAGGDLGGTYPAPIVTGLQNRPVAITAPTHDQVLKWDAELLQWRPSFDQVGGFGTVTSVDAGIPGAPVGSSGLTFSPHPITTSGSIAIANAGVDSFKLAPNAVTSSRIRDSSITGADINAATALNIASLDLTRTLRLPLTSPAAGIIFSGQDIFIHNFGLQNSFFGTKAGNLSMTGINNVGVGAAALTLNAGGLGNTAVGALALATNRGGSNNVAIGDFTLASAVDASSNTAVGSVALNGNSTGGGNTAIGDQALSENTTGSGNIAVGQRAGVTANPENANTTGSNNIFIGRNSGFGRPTQLNNAIAIGTNAIVDQSNSMVLGGIGNDAVNVGIGVTIPTERLDVDGTIRLRGITTGPGVIVVWDSLTGRLNRFGSSIRYKTNIRPLEGNTMRVLDLKPVHFQWKEGGQEDIGLIAEEVHEVEKDLVVYSGDGQPDGVKYDRVALYLLNIVKEQQEEIKKLQKAVEMLQQQVGKNPSLGDLK